MKTKNILAIASLLFLPFTGTDLFAQTNWTKDVNNPVLRRDTVVANLPNDLYAISDCWVVKQGTTYKMWYTCGGFNYPPDTLMRSRLCYATSPDGTSWLKYAGNPVLDVSYSGGWDSLGVETATVIVDSTAPLSERYKMWYAGQYFNSYRYDIGYAYSADGINWNKHPVPVLQVGVASTWDNGFLEGPSVIKDAGVYKMWYCGYDAVVDGNGTDGHANLGYATSMDGINWTKDQGNPVLTTGVNTWDSINVQDPHVIKQGGSYYMWYGGGASYSEYDQQVGFATSPDGIAWTKSAMNPVLTRGNPGEWDMKISSFPSVLNDNGMYKMWYTGKDTDPLPFNSSNYYWEIGYATAPITGVNEINRDEQAAIILFPNPVQYELEVSCAFDATSASVKIYNQFGQAQSMVYERNGKRIIIETNELPNGMYFIVMQVGDRIVSEKFIVIK